jgi:hypothetical protein
MGLLVLGSKSGKGTGQLEILESLVLGLDVDGWHLNEFVLRGSAAAAVQAFFSQVGLKFHWTRKRV